MATMAAAPEHAKVLTCARQAANFWLLSTRTAQDQVLEMMREGLAAWKQLPAERRRLAAENRIRPQHRWEESFPTGGLILSVISRDLPEQCDPLAPAEVKWNQDHVWFSKEEARQWLGDNPQPGDIRQVPGDLVARLARFHLVDSVKGQTPRFTREGVRGSKNLDRGRFQRRSVGRTEDNGRNFRSCSRKVGGNQPTESYAPGGQRHIRSR